jgi:hypothetical protein
MDSYGALDKEDPFFIDSVDSYLFDALWCILNIEESASSSAKILIKSTAMAYKNDDFRGIFSNVNSILNPLYLKSTPSEVGSYVLTFMLLQYIEGDILRLSFTEAYHINKGIVRVPTIATEFSKHNSATSVTLKGYILDDGGGAITSRGIAWAAFYNPTKDDNSIIPQTETGHFTVTLTGLTEGTTYYARTYATNSAGIVYGNCIGFTANNTTEINNIKKFDIDFNNYPNPASTLASFCFQLESSGTMELMVIDMKGQLVIKKELSNLPLGENQIKLNISDIPNGIYTCQLTNGKLNAISKLVIVH